MARKIVLTTDQIIAILKAKLDPKKVKKDKNNLVIIKESKLNGR